MDTTNSFSFRLDNNDKLRKLVAGIREGEKRVIHGILQFHQNDERTASGIITEVESLEKPVSEPEPEGEVESEDKDPAMASPVMSVMQKSKKRSIQSYSTPISSSPIA